MRAPAPPHGTGRYERLGREYFAKVVPLDDEPRVKAEREGLEALRATATVRVPRFIDEGRDEERSWLLLEWLEIGSLAASSAAALGASLAALHRIPQKRFGWEHDNYIGATVQVNGWSDDWLAFWQDKRLMPQLRLAARNRLPSRLMNRGERLAADCGAFFRSHKPQPSLLHGDLWGGNAGALADATPVVFDPAVYVGDREADLAMTALFGGFPADLEAAYRAAWAPDDGYRVRRDFYNLYHVLNHANLFAGGYVRQSEELVERLIAEIA